MIHLVCSDPETRESKMRKSRVDADMEIGAIEALKNAKLEVDRALDKASETLDRLLEEVQLESEAVTKAAELNTIRDQRVHTEDYEGEADAKNISGKCVLKPHKAQYVLRGFEEDVDEDVFASMRMTASVRMLLSQATDLRNEGHTVFTADVKNAFLNARMKDGDVVYASGSPKHQRTETLAGPFGADPQEARLRPRHAWHLPVDPHDEASVTRIPCGRLVVDWNAPDHQRSPH